MVDPSDKKDRGRYYLGTGNTTNNSKKEETAKGESDITRSPKTQFS